MKRRRRSGMRRRYGHALDRSFRVTIDTGDYEMSWTRRGDSLEDVRAQAERIARSEYGSRARVVSVREAS